MPSHCSRAISEDGETWRRSSACNAMAMLSSPMEVKRPKHHFWKSNFHCIWKRTSSILSCIIDIPSRAARKGRKIWRISGLGTLPHPTNYHVRAVEAEVMALAQTAPASRWPRQGEREQTWALHVRNRAWGGRWSSQLVFMPSLLQVRKTWGNPRAEDNCLWFQVETTPLPFQNDSRPTLHEKTAER